MIPQSNINLFIQAFHSKYCKKIDSQTHHLKEWLMQQKFLVSIPVAINEEDY
jgi:hypothetical protein